MSHAATEINSGLEPLLSTAHVAHITGGSISTLEKDRLFGTGPAFIKVGRSVKYRLRDVRAWIESFQSVQTTHDAAEPRLAIPGHVAAKRP
jgi:hypothetical protein